MHWNRIGLVGIVLATSCQSTPISPDDAGDAQWVMEAIPTLLGRPAKSTLEVQALTDIVTLKGRAHVADLLMQRPEFARYWALVLLEDMKLDRSGPDDVDRICMMQFDPAFPGVISAYDPSFEGPMTDARAANILSWIGPGTARVATNAQADNSFPELVEAAVQADRLDLAFAAHMPVLAATHYGENKTNLRIRFADRVINRDLDCIACHNGEYSTTDDSLQASRNLGGWDRTWPTSEVVLEGGLFDYVDGSGTAHSGVSGGATVRANMNELFGVEQWGGGDSIFGLRSACVARYTGQGYWALDVSTYPSTTAKFAGLDGNYSVLDLTDEFLATAQNLGTIAPFPYEHVHVRSAPPLPAPGTPTYSGVSCTSCHTDPDGVLAYDPGFAQIPDARILQVLTSDPPPQMAGANCMGAADPQGCAEQVLLSIRSVVPYEPKDEYDTPQKAFAMAVALQVVDHVVEEIGGSRLTLSHGFPRSVDAAEVQRELVHTLVNSGWSLRAVLSDIVLDDAFNRLPPGTSTNFGVADAYQLPQIAKPYEQLQPGSPADSDNYASLGDSVHRHSITHLTEKMHHALGWSSSWTPGDDSGPVYPAPSYLASLGRWESGVQPGFDDAVLPGLLNWEATMGTCTKPGASVRSPQMVVDPAFAQHAWAYDDHWTDWIDALVDTSIASGWTTYTAAAMLRERLLQDPTFLAGEDSGLAALASATGVGNIYTSASTLDPADFEQTLREYCGALVTSPQFLMGGISTSDASVALATGAALPPRPVFNQPAPVLPSIDPTEPQTFGDWCAEYGLMLNLDGTCTLEVLDTDPGGLTDPGSGGLDPL